MTLNRYVDQGGGKRKGAFAIYIEPWHADIFDFLDLRKNHGKEEARPALACASTCRNTADGMAILAAACPGHLVDKDPYSCTLWV